MIRNDYFNDPDNLPDYYDTMYLDGFEPWQILDAHRKTMINQITERQNPEENDFNIITKVSVKE